MIESCDRPKPNCYLGFYFGKNKANVKSKHIFLFKSIFMVFWLRGESNVARRQNARSSRLLK